jgi:hypothetical protein
MCLKVLSPISGRQMKLESELGPATSMSRWAVLPWNPPSGRWWQCVEYTNLFLRSTNMIHNKYVNLDTLWILC